MDFKTIVNVPWASNDSSWKGKLSADKADDAYSRVPLIYRAVKFRCNSLCRVPFYIYDAQDNIIETGYEFEDVMPMANLIYKSEMALLLTGFSVAVKLMNSATFSGIGLSFPKGPQWLNPFSIQWEIVGNDIRFWQETSTGQRFPKKGFWIRDELIYLREFNPNDDLGPGISPTQVALGDGKILLSVTQFLGDFFSADALPITIAMLPSGATDAQKEQVQTWFQKKIRGLKHAIARVLAVSGDVKLEKLTSELKTFDFAQVDDHAIRDIAWAFEVPKTLLTADSANFATAESEYRSYIDNTLVPRTKYYESELNKYLAEFEQRIEFAPEEMPEMQEDENQRAQSLSLLVQSGLPLVAALDILGYDLSEEAQAALDEKLSKPPVVPVTPQQGTTGAPVPATPTNGKPQPLPVN